MDQSKFWKSVGKSGISYANKNRIPMEEILDDGSISFNTDVVLRKWQTDFSSLFSAKDTNCDQGNASGNTSSHVVMIPLTTIPINN